MSFTASWLIPRVGFWILWTAWLFCAQAWQLTGLALLTPPLCAIWLGSRWAPNPLDRPNPLFWKGAAVSGMIAMFSALWIDSGTAPSHLLLWPPTILAGWLALRGPASQRVEIRDGELADAVREIAARAGVPAPRTIVFGFPRPAAFAARTGAILLSEPLLRLLSRRETDAVIAHEVSHLRPANVRWIALLPLAPCAAFAASMFYPATAQTAPLWPAMTMLAFLFLRRAQERDADAAAVANAGDGEALISALVRVAAANGVPLGHGSTAGALLAHPPMLERFRRIARQSRIEPERLKQIIANASEPSGAGYPVTLPAGNAASFEEYMSRIGARLLSWQIGAPALSGTAAAIGAIAFDLPALWTITAGVLAGAVLHVAGYEAIVKRERRRVGDRLRAAGASGHFAGLAWSSEPRLYEGGGYHHDLGLVAVEPGLLRFTGTRCSFALEASRVMRVWMAAGPPNWIPRKTVCVEYESASEAAVVSLQSFEDPVALLADLRDWAAAGAPSPNPQPEPPQADGAIPQPIPMSAIWRIVQYAAGGALAAASLAMALLEDLDNLFACWIAPAVTAILVLFAVAPRILPRWPGAARTGGAYHRREGDTIA